MKKISIVSLFSFLFLFLASVVAYVLGFVNFEHAWVPLVIGVAILIVSGLVALVVKRIVGVNVLCSIISAVALGFMIRSWYVFRGFENALWILVCVSLACVVYLWAVFGLAHLPFARNHPKIFLLIVVLVSLAGYVCLLIFTQTTFVSTFGYYMIVEIAFLFAMFVTSDSVRKLIRNLTLSTYSVFIVAIIIAIMILSEGEVGIDFDFFIYVEYNDGDYKKNKKKKNNNQNQTQDHSEILPTHDNAEPFDETKSA